MDGRDKICVGMIAGAHGVRGQVRLRSFTEDPEAIASYGDLTSEDGSRPFKLHLEGIAKDLFVASIGGVADRDAAEDLKGTRLYAPRSSLPKLKKRGAYYAADLVGLDAFLEDGKDMGQVLDVHNYGAGPFLEIGHGRRDSFMLPFNDTCVPAIDIANGKAIIAVPEGWLASNAPESKAGKVKKRTMGNDEND